MIDILTAAAIFAGFVCFALILLVKLIQELKKHNQEDFSHRSLWDNNHAY